VRVSVTSTGRCVPCILEEYVEFALLLSRHRVDLAKPGGGFAFELDCVIPLSPFGEAIEGSFAEDIVEVMEAFGGEVAE